MEVHDNYFRIPGAYVWHEGTIKRITNQYLGSNSDVLLDNMICVRKTDLVLCKEGDLVSFKDSNILPDRCRNEKEPKIISFMDNDLVRLSDGDTTHYSHLKKPHMHPASIKIDDVEYDLIPKKPIKNKPFIFISDDKKEIYSGDRYWLLINNMENIIECNTENYIEGQHEDTRAKRFSTEQAAKDYVIFNKQCLSLNEIINVMIKNSVISKDKAFHIHGSNTVKELKEIIKEILNY